MAGGEVVFVYVAWGGGSEGDVAALGAAGEGVQEEGLAGQETAEALEEAAGCACVEGGAGHVDHGAGFGAYGLAGIQVDGEDGIGGSA